MTAWIVEYGIDAPTNHINSKLSESESRLLVTKLRERYMDSQEVVIHVRFAPNGRVIQISERPAKLTPNQWFDVLHTRAGSAYRPLARGRGAFRLSRTAVDHFKQQTAGHR